MLRDWINSQIFNSTLRNLAQWVGASLAMKGVITDDQNTLVVGAIIAVGTLVASLLSAKFNHVAVEAAGGKEAVKQIIADKKAADKGL